MKVNMTLFSINKRKNGFSSCLLVGNLKTSFIQHYEKMGLVQLLYSFDTLAVAYLVSKFKSLRLDA